MERDTATHARRRGHDTNPPVEIGRDRERQRLTRTCLLLRRKWITIIPATEIVSQLPALDRLPDVLDRFQDTLNCLQDTLDRL